MKGETHQYLEFLNKPYPTIIEKFKVTIILFFFHSFYLILFLFFSLLFLLKLFIQFIFKFFI